MLKRFTALGLACLLLVTTVFAGGCSKDSSKESTPSQTTTVQKRDLVLGGGAMGGVYYVLGAAMKGILEQKVPGVGNVVVQAGTSSQFAAGLQAGKNDLYLATPDGLYFAWSDEAGAGFKATDRFDKIRFTAAGHLNVQDLVVLEGSAIKTIKDIGNKKIATNTATVVPSLKEFLIANGIKEPNVVVIADFNQLAQELRNGSVAAIHVISAHPTPSLTELAVSVPIRLLNTDEESINSFLKRNKETSFFQKIVQPAGTYPWQKEDYLTVGRGLVAATSKDLPDDLVYEMTKAIYESPDELGKAHVLGKDINLKMLQKYFDDGVVQVPIHPGSRRYFEEKGIKIPASVPKA